MEELLKKYPLLKDQNVSRETITEFESFITMLQKRNEEINIISKETAKNELIRERHIVDSAQIIDFVDLNNNTTSDLGTGGGFPGIIVSIMIKNMKKDTKLKLYEKSQRKSSFLREVSRKLNLDIEVIQKDIFETRELKTGTIMARAFKPLPLVLDLVYKNFTSYKNLIIFMGKSGNKILEETLKNWELDYEKKKSITNDDSFLLNIKQIKRKN